MVIFGVDFQQFLTTYGPWAIFFVMFAESALIFFLPGDSFLFVAGVLVAQGILGFWPAALLGIVGAILGNTLGYYIGKKFGEAMFAVERQWLFKKKHVDKVQEYYEKYGPLTIVLARFVPGIRTIAPIAAGVGKMNYFTFFIYNVGGAVLWLMSILTAGYFLGSVIPKESIDKYILIIIFGVIFLSLIPGLFAYFRSKKKKIEDIIIS